VEQEGPPKTYFSIKTMRMLRKKMVKTSIFRTLEFIKGLQQSKEHLFKENG
jgi:hypothetical protein